MKNCLIFVLITILYSCGGGSGDSSKYGGSLKMCLDNQPSTVIARNAADLYSATLLHQVYEGLVAFDVETSAITPCLASDWTISSDGTSYAFTLRDDVYFHEHSIFKSLEDRKLKPSDVQFSIELICKKQSNGTSTQGFELVFKESLKGASEFFEGKANSISGLSIDGNTVHMELLNRDDNFLARLASIQAVIVSQKIIESDNESFLIGTGPFKYSEQKNDKTEEWILLKNPDYYGVDSEGLKLPYLDSIVFICETRKLEQLALFESKKVDLISGLPTSRITKMLDGNIDAFNSTNSEPPKMVLNKNPLLVTNYYFFNMKDERFADPRVRQAFNYAVNKEKIGLDILRNQYEELGNYGIVPPVYNTFRGYDFEQIANYSYHYDPAKARALLAQAGYPKGEGFGSVNLRFNIGDINSAVADEFAQQIFQVLGINVNIDGSSFDMLNADASTGNGDIFRTAWGADYPNPETFLNNFYGGNIPANEGEPSSINKSLYSNPKFDSYFEQAKSAERISEKMDLYCKAEIELMKNPPIIPLWYNGDMQVYYSNVRNLHFNSLSIFDFKNVYKKEWTKEEYMEKLQSEQHQ